MHTLTAGSDVHQALDLIAKIDAAGGPPRGKRVQYDRVRVMVNDAAAKGPDLGADELGIIHPVLVWLLGLAGAMTLGTGGYLVWQSMEQLEKAARVVVWAGATWVVYSLLCQSGAAGKLFGGKFCPPPARARGRDLMEDWDR